MHSSGSWRCRLCCCRCRCCCGCFIFLIYTRATLMKICVARQTACFVLVPLPVSCCSSLPACSGSYCKRRGGVGTGTSRCTSYKYSVLHLRPCLLAPGAGAGAAAALRTLLLLWFGGKLCAVVKRLETTARRHHNPVTTEPSGSLYCPWRTAKRG